MKGSDWWRTLLLRLLQALTPIQKAEELLALPPVGDRILHRKQ
jgi:hypothetical protein